MAKKHTTKICYLLLCHKDPEAIIEQINYLLSTGGYVVVHIDKRSAQDNHAAIHHAFDEEDRVLFTDPVKAGWGDWSLVDATLRMIDTGLDSFVDATNFYLLSGDCVPIRSHEDLKQELGKQRIDIIETSEFYEGGWIKTGPHLERVQFYHIINERKFRKLFYSFYSIQRLFQIERQVPQGIELSIGSQWWCLRRRTLERIRVYIRARPDVIRFFKWCWVPDEIFFQSLVATLVPASERINKPPTFLRFSDYGLPTVFYDDHYHFLIAQDEFFARKISPNVKRVKRKLIERFLAPSTGEKTVSTGRNTIGFNTYAGRNGMRFGASFWEKGGRLPADSRLFIIVSKKWHVGREFGRRVSEVTGVPFFSYVFDENSEELGTLGGFETHINKRLEQPVSLIRILLETKKLNQAIIGIDPSRTKEMQELIEGAEDIRAIEIENQYSPEYLDGHAERSGLMTEYESSVQKAALHRTIIEIFRDESSKVKKLKFSRFGHIRDWHNAKTRAEILSGIFEQEPDDFLELAREFDIRD